MSSIDPVFARRRDLKNMDNDELSKRYDTELIFRLRNPKNLSDTRKMLAKFINFLAGRPPSPDLAKEFLAPYACKKPKTLYRYAQMIKSFLKWYGQPMDDFKVKIPKTLPPYVEDDQIAMLINAMGDKKTHKKTIVRDQLLVQLAVKTGLRRAEMANLEAGDVHPDFLIVRNGKGGKDRVIPLSLSIAQRLNAFVSVMEPKEKVFKLQPPGISMKIRNFANKAGLPDMHTHSIRHKFATDLLERNADLKTVQELMGHEDLSTTQGYLAVTSKRKRDAINSLDRPKGGEKIKSQSVYIDR